LNLPISLPSKLVDQRPDVRAAEANMHAASALARLPAWVIDFLLGRATEDG
jgi:hypothetical protein